MAHTSRIKTPLKQHLHRFRLGALPVISFIGCVLLTLWLWERQVTVGSLLGEIEAESVTVVAGTDGRILARDDETYIKRHDNVRAGELIARLDDSELRARMDTAKATIVRLQADVEAARSNFQLDELNLDQNETRQQARLELEVERLKLAAIQQLGLVKELRQELLGANAVLEFAPLLDRLQMLQRSNQRDTIQARLEEEEKVFQEYKKQLTEAVEAAEKYTGIQLPKVETVLQPIRAERQVQEALIEELTVLMDKLNITAPIDGVVSEVIRVPGEQVMAGDPIATIVSPDTSYVVSYVRESHRLPLIAGMKVSLRLRDDPDEEYESRVQRVGPHVQPVPPHQLSDRATPEWGSPIFIPIPLKLQEQQDRIRPGQLLHVVIPRPRQRR